MRIHPLNRAAATLAAVLLLVASSGWATAGIQIDGSLGPNEWGLTFNGTSLDFGSSAVVNNATHPGNTGLYSVDDGTTNYSVFYHAEDSNDNFNGYYVGPNHGGQNYDAEFLGVSIHDARLNVVVVSGQRPDNGFSYYGPGDFRLVTTSGTFAMEVGGGAGGASSSGTIFEGDPGTTYSLNGSGYTTGVSTDTVQVAGSLWSDPTWSDDPISPAEPTQLLGGTYVGMADYAFSRNDGPEQHSVIELALAMELFGGPGTRLESIHWRPSCGNDELNVAWPSPPPQDPVPEPSSLLLWGLLLSGAMGVCWRRRRVG